MGINGITTNLTDRFLPQPFLKFFIYCKKLLVSECIIDLRRGLPSLSRGKHPSIWPLRPIANIFLLQSGDWLIMLLVVLTTASYHFSGSCSAQPSFGYKVSYSWKALATTSPSGLNRTALLPVVPRSWAKIYPFFILNNLSSYIFSVFVVPSISYIELSLNFYLLSQKYLIYRWQFIIIFSSCPLLAIAIASLNSTKLYLRVIIS